MNGKLERASKVVEIVTHIVTCVAIIIGGTWTLWTFVINRSDTQREQAQAEREDNRREEEAQRQKDGRYDILQLNVVPQLMDFDDRNKLLLVNWSAKNIGVTRLRPSDKGCQLKLWRFNDSVKPDQAFQWRDKTEVICNVDLLRGYPSYVIKPGVEYQEVEPVLLSKSGLYLVRVRFHLDDSDTVTDYKVINVPAPTSSKTAT